MRPAHRARLVVALAPAVLTALLGGACQSSASGSARKLVPAPPQVVQVRMQEYRFAYDAVIAPGRVVFDVRNDGRLQHRLALLPLPDDLPPIDVQVHGSQHRVVSPYAGVPDRRPGQRGVFAADLVAGRRYGLVCFVVDADGATHALKGMTAEFRVTGA